MAKKIRVLIADDSKFICSLLAKQLQHDPEIEVVAIAENGKQAVEMVKQYHPDVITLDLEMPVMNGLEAIEKIMAENPTPTIVIAGVSKQEAKTTLDAINLGAIDFVFKYVPGSNLDPKELFREIVLKVKAAAKTKLIRSLKNLSGNPINTKLANINKLPVTTSKDKDFLSKPYSLLPAGVIVIGASTGGPVALRELLNEIPDNFPAAILIVQHIPTNFTKVLATQLNRQVNIEVKEAQEADKLKANQVLIAPGDFHMTITPDSKIKLIYGVEIEGHRPSIDVTMQSVAEIYGNLAKGVLLTGMGKDGSQGLLAIRSKGGTTFAQNEETCVINGMPQRAIELNVVDYVASPKNIASLLVKQLMQFSKPDFSTNNIQII
jgi:two-component system chemotaxis response regulator CheB